MKRRGFISTLALSLTFAAGTSMASPAQPPATSHAPAAATTLLAPLVVSATRRLEPSFDVPASVTALNRRDIARAQPQINLSESLRTVPGVVAQNRQDYAEDLQISIRGFGSLAPFGVQGIRLLLDGLPATMPDGQGQPQVFDLPAIARLEVLRGPFALTYGNSPGGVIRASTLDGTAQTAIRLRDWLGNYGATQATFSAGGPLANAGNYRVTATRFHTDGYRDHGTATRKQLYAKAKYTAGPTTLTFIASLFHQRAEDPSGLTSRQVAQDPRQAAPRAVSYDARKDVHNAEAGVVGDTHLDGSESLHASVYAGTRSVLQYLPFAGDAGLSSGGVVDLADYFGGVRGHFTDDGHFAGHWYTLTAGLDYDRENEYRKGYVNDAGAAGALRRDEFDVVDDIDPYLQARLEITPKWSLEGGLRYNFVRFTARDHFITATNPNDSGHVTFQHTDPVIGVLYRFRPHLHLYANAGRGFETPTFYQLAYRPDGSPGLNLDLAPAVSDSYEAGAKILAGHGIRLDASVFRINTRDDIVVASSRDGRTSYRNAANTRRDGAEIRIDGRLQHHLNAVVALDYIDTRFTGGIDSGRQIPGVPARTAYLGLTWQPPRTGGFFTTVDMQYRDRVYVDSGNSASAAPYAIIDWRAGFHQGEGRWRFSEFVRVDNILDRRYVGAVVVGDANRRYFEPAPGRNYTLGVTLARRL